MKKKFSQISIVIFTKTVHAIIFIIKHYFLFNKKNQKQEDVLKSRCYYWYCVYLIKNGYLFLNI